MDYCLQVPSADVIWLFSSTTCGFTYSLVVRPIEVKNKSQIYPVVDKLSQLHLIIPDHSYKAIHLIWDNFSWRKNDLSIVGWEELLSYIDSANRLHFLARNSSTLHLFTSPTEAGFPDLKYSIPEHGLDVISFTVKKSTLYIYLLNRSKNTLRLISICRMTGKKLSENILIRNRFYMIKKCWVIEDFIILAMINRNSPQAYLYLLKINLATNKQWLERFKLSKFEHNLSFHLVKNQSDLILLVSSSADYFIYFYSYDCGQTWTSPKQSNLFCPLAFSEINGINNYPASFICIIKIRGIILQYPLLLSYAELSSMLQ